MLISKIILQRALHALLLYIAAAALFFAPVVFSEKTFIARDHYLFYNPRQYCVAEAVHAGDLPLWNPYVACGTPCQAGIQSMVFYPLSVLFYTVPFQKGFKYYVVVHYVLAAFFMFLLMRSWSASAVSSFIAGLVFAFGGYCVSINDNVSFLTSASWTPLTLLGFQYLIKKQTLAAVAVAAMLVGIQVLAGDASFYLLSSFLITFFYITLHLITTRPVRWSYLARHIGLFSSAWAVGFLLAAIQLVPFFELVWHSHRAVGLSFAQASKWSFHPLELFQLLVPYAFGSIVPGTRWMGQLWLDTLYIGIFPLSCCLLYLYTEKKKLKPFLLILFFTGLFLGCGRYNPFYKYLFSTIPVIGMMQYPVKFLYITHFSLSIMAGLGIEHLVAIASKPSEARRLCGFIAAVILFLVVLIVALPFLGERGYLYFITMYPKTEYFQPIAQDQWNHLWEGVAVLVALLSILLSFVAVLSKGVLTRPVAVFLSSIIIFVDLLVFGKPEDPYLPESVFREPTRTGQFLKQDESLFRIYSLATYQTQRSFLHVYYMPFEKVYRVIREMQQANTNIYEGLQSAEEYSDLLLRKYYDLFSEVERCFSEKRFNQPGARLCIWILSLLNVKYILSPFALDMLPLRLVLDGPIKVYENPSVLPRAFLCDRIIVCGDGKEVLTRMLGEGCDPGAQVFITASEAQKVSIRKDLSHNHHGSTSSPGAVEISLYRPTRIELRVSLDRQAMLVLSDTYYPGWEASDNGRKIPVLQVDHTLRGVMLEPGVHKVIFLFRPFSLVCGTFLTFAALIGFFPLAFFSRKKHAPFCSKKELRA